MKTKRVITEKDVRDFFYSNINLVEDSMGIMYLNPNTMEIVFDFNAVLLLSFDGLYADKAYNIGNKSFSENFNKLLKTSLSMEIKQNTAFEYTRKTENCKYKFLVKLEKQDNGNIKFYFISLETLLETEKQLSLFSEVIGAGTSMFAGCTWWIDNDLHTTKFYSTDTGPKLLGVPVNKDMLYNTKEFQKVREKAKEVSEFYEESIEMEAEAYERVRENKTDYFGGRTPTVTTTGKILWVECYGKCLIRYPDGSPRLSVAIDIYQSEIFEQINQLKIIRNLSDTGLISSDVGLWYFQNHFKEGRYYFTESYNKLMASDIEYKNETIVELFDIQSELLKELSNDYKQYLRDFRDTHNNIFLEGLDKYHSIVPIIKNGDLQWIDVRGTVIERDKDGEVLLFVGVNVNITESYNKNIELENLRIQNERLRFAENLAVKARDLLVWYIDTADKTKIRYIFGNDVIEEKLGVERTSNGLISLNDLKKTFYVEDEPSKKNAKKAMRELLNLIIGKKDTLKKLLVKHKNLKTNEIIYLEHSVEVSESSDGKKTRMVGGVMLDVTENVLYQEKIQFLANYDVLTETYNRNYFEQYIKTKLPFTYTILVFDIDGLKLVNDVFGHLQGDNILKQVSEFLKTIYHDDLFISRIGGDEFVVLSKDVDQTIITDKANLFEKMILDYNNQNSIEINVSKGGILVSDNNLSFDKAFIESENIMYRRKLNNRSSRKSKVLESILETLNAKTEETKEHSFRLADLAVKTINELGFIRSSEKEDMILLAKVHDIGKITIPDNVLFKKSILTKSEFEIVKKHCEAGYNIIRNITNSDRVCNGVLFHHERWDGLGYPQGLKEDKIPLFARVVCVVDSYDAMTNDRIYKKKITHEEAVEEIIQCSGTQFDPKIVKAFLKSCFNIELK